MSAEGEIRDVQVEVTLAGGVRHSLVLPSNSPLLRDLHVALFKRAADQSPAPAFLLQLPIDNGHAACSFMSDTLTALKTTPPVLIAPLPAAVVNQAEATSPPAPHGLDCVCIDDFLTPGENEKLLDYALANESNFEGSGVFGTNEDHRRSKVLYAIKHSKWRDILLGRIKMHLPYIVLALNIPEFRVDGIEIQLTASNDGDFFKPHADHSAEAAGAATRELTYVYYFHREPKPFAGGGLFLYGGQPDPYNYGNLRGVSGVEPRNNRLIAFASKRWHELDVVRCPSGKFVDSRFTVNGWLHPVTLRTVS